MRRVEITPVVTHKMTTLANNGQCLIRILLIGGHLIPRGQAADSHLAAGNVTILLQILAASAGLVPTARDGRCSAVDEVLAWAENVDARNFAISLDKCPMLR